MSSKWNNDSSSRWISPDDDTETNLARDKLDNLLQDLKENPARAKESSRYRDENLLGPGGASSYVAGEKDLLGGSTLGVGMSGSLGGPSASAFGALGSRGGAIVDSSIDGGSIAGGIKKRKLPPGRGDTEEPSSERNPYVLRVYDRAVDFAAFDETTPIYPMARAWIRNMNQGDTSSWTDLGTNIHGQGDDEHHASDHPFIGDSFYNLPKPLDGRRDAEVRIPRVVYPMKSATEDFVIYEQNPDPNITPETLIASHLARWQDIRKRWKIAARENEARYIEAYYILKDVYEKTGKDVAS